MNGRSKDRLFCEEHSSLVIVAKPEAGDISWSDEVIQGCFGLTCKAAIDMGLGPFSQSFT